MDGGDGVSGCEIGIAIAANALHRVAFHNGRPCPSFTVVCRDRLQQENGSGLESDGPDARAE